SAGAQRRAVGSLAVASRFAVAEMDLAGELDAVRPVALTLARGGEHGAVRTGAGVAGQPIDHHLLGRKSGVETDVLVDALPHHVEEASAQVRVALRLRLGEDAGELDVALERAAGASDVGQEAGEEGEVELFGLHLSLELPVEDRHRAAPEQRAPAQVSLQLRVGEEIAA